MHNGSSQLEQVASSKRRRQDQDYSVYVAPSTSRTAKQAANGRAAEAARTAQLKKDDSVHTPLLDLATLLQRYLSRYGLLEAHGSLSYHHAVFPLVVERLAQRAKAHWDKKDSVKEGETLTNFIFALRMRG
ncbi:hypothetical protein RQP46_003742 [Phenoliferia psychrophenolica]